ncbi:MAG: MFS transporter [Gammaproteobacteria bacterium]|nr:MFS transporter [Gammaproteobacteria bacterium]
MKTIKVIMVSIICYSIGLVFYSFDPLMQSFPSILTNQLMKNFAISSVGVGVIASSYFYSYNLMQIPAGMICDKLGSKMVLSISSVICILGLTFFAYSTSLEQAIFARIVMGLGASCAAVVFLLLCKQYFDIKYLPVLIGVGQFAGNIGAMGGQYFLTFVTNVYGWRASINILSVIPIILIVFTIIFLSKNIRSGTQNNKIDGTHHIKNVIANKSNWITAIYAMLLWAPFYTFASLWGIPFLKELLSISTDQASKLMTIAWLGSGVGSILIGVWSSLIGKRKICLAASASLGAVVFLIMIFTKTHNDIFLSCMLFIFGCSSAGQALSFVLIADKNTHQNLGLAVGFNNTAIMIGPMLLDPIVGWMLNRGWDGQICDGVLIYSAQDYMHAFVIIPILFIGALVVGLSYDDNKDEVKV